MKRTCCFLILFAALTILSSSAWATDRVVSIGDSWGYAFPEFLNEQFTLHGHGDTSVLNLAIPGATAQAYADNVGGVLDISKAALLVKPDIQWVFISLGGNDLLGRYLSSGMAVFDEIDADIRYVVSQLLAVRPDIEICLAAYDFPNFEQSEFCILDAALLFGLPITTYEINNLFLGIGQVQETIAADTPRVEYVCMWGTLQGSPCNPDLYAPSPSSMMGGPEDCIHANSTGYRALSRVIYDTFFAPRLTGGCVGAFWADGRRQTGSWWALILVAVILAVAPMLVLRSKRRSYLE